MIAPATSQTAGVRSESPKNRVARVKNTTALAASVAPWSALTRIVWFVVSMIGLR
ncbi:MAG: hypothetical protein RLZZ449_836, partial [Actinomycetota bacterium]